MNPLRIIGTNILEGIGNTSFIKLNRISGKNRIELFAKLEYLNPMGSIKDRIAKHMIEKAERDGRLSPGATVIDNSSGNSALALVIRKKIFPATERPAPGLPWLYF